MFKGVADSKFRFLDAFVGYPGRCHDASVWRSSPLKQALENRRITISPDYHLLGDSAYPLEINLMVPYRDNGFLTAEQQRFNSSLNSTRVFIEQTFGILKAKFRMLNYVYVKNLPLAKHIIMSCIIIHNIILDNEEFNTSNIELEQTCTDDNDNANTTSQCTSNIEAKTKRELLTTLISV